ncbi:MAG: hypothetical protein HY905_06210 [Deltaproteobacteria bacterium]|nr:hypothetical protein [Deltaproteobacteria bacterium]
MVNRSMPRRIRRTAVVLLASTAWLAGGGSCARKQTAATRPGADVVSARGPTAETSATPAPAAPNNADAAQAAEAAVQTTRAVGPALPPPGEPIDRTPVCTHEAHAGVPELPPPDVLVESSIVPPTGTPTGVRIRQDGRVESRQADGSWLSGKTLSGAEMEEVRRAIVDAHLERAAGLHRLESPDPTVAESRLFARVGTELVTVISDEPCFLPEVHSLMLVLVEMFD